jgi:leucyl/phenylalanyl-tRNA--protein transferase
MENQPAPDWHEAFPRIAIDGEARRPTPIRRSRYRFPPPESVAAEGAATLGADFAPATIVEAYRSGYFPWPHDDMEMLWFSPDPRAIIPLGGLHISRRLGRLLRRLPFRVTIDEAFDAVLDCCAVRVDDGTWITPRYKAGYGELHRLGWAHSFEVWTDDGTLAGGLYGLRVGTLFGAESMFHRVTDASKVAMAAMMQWAEETDVTLVDIQVLTPHTERMGGIEVTRDEYLERLKPAVARALLPAIDPAGRLA